MSMNRNNKLHPNHKIRSIALRSPINPLLKNPSLKSSQLKSSQPYTRSYRTLTNPISPSIFIKGNQTPAFETVSPPKPSKSRSVCLIRDAIQSREWLIKARENILQEIGLFINASNCLKVEVPQGTFTYKYYLSKGNNSALVKQCLNTRPWWTPVEEDQINSANFVWTQFKNSEHFLLMPIAYERLKRINHSIQGKSINCSILYEDITNCMRAVDVSGLGYDLITKSKHYIGFEDNFRIDPCASRVQNKLEFNFNLSDKKFLYKNMKEYYESDMDNVFNYLPLTYHIGHDLKELQNFINKYSDIPIKCLWIVKPGENTNRGYGIFITNNLNKILSEITTAKMNKNEHTFIIQKYIEKPFLINKRKFDIRLYTMITSINGVFQAYYYQEGYLRTASKAYNPQDLENIFIHLTNDAIQNKCEDYGKFEKGNKLSYHDFQRYLDSKNIKVNFLEEIIPKIKKIVKDTVKATYTKLNENRRLLGFEIFGYDFLLDANLRPWLLEVNTNPCLELSSTILARIIPAMLENALKIALDPLFPEPKGNLRKFSSRSHYLLPENKFELIYHQDVN
ncbi:hypothetical protein SteCoe_27535 [Stentor coeruleus]|uniref:Tubulin--tyrosine ligase-like protein 9 n=1 Tax=Stentor coeruleus TaxID=5963 RepID=A0A1R2BA97_9CILI|nr:hypothetical protein SteCoe_27535 [Stentor coeruleus]